MTKAEAFLKASGIADTVYFGPEAEFYIFDEVRFDNQPQGSFFKIDSIEAAWNTGREEEGGNLGYKTPFKGGYFPVPPVDHFADFIRSPFIYQGIVYSMTGSFLAGLIYFIVSMVMFFTNFLGIRDLTYVSIVGDFRIHFLIFSFGLAILINFVGYLLGRLGSKTAIQNYLQI